MRDEPDPRLEKPDKDPSADFDWRRDQFWDPDWRPNQGLEDEGFFKGVLFFLLSLTGALSSAAGLLLLIVVGLIWAASTLMVILAVADPSRRGADFGIICAVTAVSWLLVLYLRRRRTASRKSSENPPEI